MPEGGVALSRLSTEGYHLYTLTPSVGDEGLVLYLLGYLVLIFMFACTLSNLLAAGRNSSQPLALLAHSVQVRVRWLLVYLLLSLAGLPPFFFFGCKLGLLGLLLGEGAYVGSCCVAGLILLSWAVYFSAIRYLLTPVLVSTSAPLRHGRLGPGGALAGIVSGALLCLGLVLFEDACLISVMLGN
jgi:NADH:ubiquinone oxidoreductase subunit 2 (subunit N)